MSGTFRVTVSKDYLAFSSAHFITFRGHQCEALHGHNYRVGITAEGAVDPECHFVVDFTILKQVVKPLVDAIDHRVLLPTENPKLTISTEGEQLAVDYRGERRYVFPRNDCALLPIPNSTAEMLAEYLARQVCNGLAARGVSGLTRVTLEVEESPGQSASYELIPGRP